MTPKINNNYRLRSNEFPKASQRMRKDGPGPPKAPFMSKGILGPVGNGYSSGGAWGGGKTKGRRPLMTASEAELRTAAMAAAAAALFSSPGSPRFEDDPLSDKGSLVPLLAQFPPPPSDALFLPW